MPSKPSVGKLYPNALFTFYFETEFTKLLWLALNSQCCPNKSSCLNLTSTWDGHAVPPGLTHAICLNYSKDVSTKQMPWSTEKRSC